MLSLLGFLFLGSVSACGVDIAEFLLSGDDDFEVTLKPSPEASQLKKVYLKTELGYDLHKWSAAQLNNDLTATWRLTSDHAQSLRLRGDSYTVWASSNQEDWGEPFKVEYCQFKRPQNQTTIVLSGRVDRNVITTTDKIRIASGAVIGMGVHIESRFEVILEDGITFVAAPYLREPIYISSYLPIDISELSINIMSPEMPYGGKVSLETYSIEIYDGQKNGDGASYEIFKDSKSIGFPQLCSLKGYSNHRVFSGQRNYLLTKYDCPTNSVSLMDNIVVWLVASVALYAFFLRALSADYSGVVWMNLSMGAAVIFIFVSWLVTELLAVNNFHRCVADQLCTIEEEIVSHIQLIFPWCFGLLGNFVLLIWYNKIFYYINKGWGEELLIGWTSRQMIMVQAVGCATIIFSNFFVIWIPILLKADRSMPHENITNGAFLLFATLSFMPYVGALIYSMIIDHPSACGVGSCSQVGEIHVAAFFYSKITDNLSSLRDSVEPTPVGVFITNHLSTVRNVVEPSLREQFTFHF